MPALEDCETAADRWIEAYPLAEVCRLFDQVHGRPAGRYVTFLDMTAPVAPASEREGMNDVRRGPKRCMPVPTW